MRGDPVLWTTCGIAGITAIVAAVEDAKVQKLRNAYTSRIAIVFVLGLIVHAIWPERGGLPLDRVLLGVALFSGPWFVVHLIRPSAVGFGDVKYTAALGIGLGWIDSGAALEALVLVLLIGGLHALAKLLRHRSLDNPVPLGPSIFAGWALSTVCNLV